MLLDPDIVIPEVCAGVSKEFFFSPGLRTIYELLIELSDKRLPIDPVAIQQTLIDRKWLDLVGGPATILELYSFVPTAAHASHYAEILREKHELRSLIKHATDAITAAHADPEDPRAIIDRTISQLMGIGTIAGIDGRRATFDELASDFFERLTERDKPEAPRIPGVPLGIEAIDELIGGVTKEFCVVGAPSSGGKTALCIQAAIAAATAGKKVAIFSYEITKAQVFDRAICHFGGISAELLKQAPRFWTAEQRQQIERTAAALGEMASRIVCYTASGFTMSDVLRLCRKEKARGGLDMVIVDYLQMVNTRDMNEDRREREVAMIAESCKNLNLELGCAVWAPTQLTEGRTSDGKKIYTARESKAIENAADVFLMCDPESGIWVQKNRNGRRHMHLPVFLDGDTQTFRQVCSECSGSGKLSIGGSGAAVTCHHCAGSGFHRPAGAGIAF